MKHTSYYSVVRAETNMGQVQRHLRFTLEFTNESTHPTLTEIVARHADRGTVPLAADSTCLRAPLPNQTAPSFPYKVERRN